MNIYFDQVTVIIRSSSKSLLKKVIQLVRFSSDHILKRAFLEADRASFQLLLVSTVFAVSASFTIFISKLCPPCCRLIPPHCSRPEPAVDHTDSDRHDPDWRRRRAAQEPRAEVIAESGVAAGNHWTKEK